MEVYQVPKIKMIFTFDLLFVNKIKEKIKELHENSISWNKFVECLKDKFFKEDSKRMTKRSFLEWIEQRLGC